MVVIIKKKGDLLDLEGMEEEDGGGDASGLSCLM